MRITRYFEYTPELELTVAQIGVNKWEWTSMGSDSMADAQSLMEANKFDILPIETSAGIHSYFKTEMWGDYSAVRVRQIEARQKIYYRLSFFDFLKRMQDDQAMYYFLTDSKEVLGMVSISNLNCLAVYNYIYQITAGLERTVSSFIRSIATEDRIIEILGRTSDKNGKKILESYAKLKAENAENSIFEHLYFPTLGTILKNLAEEIPEEQNRILDFRTKFDSQNLYGRFRNDVSHPIKPLFRRLTDVEEVNTLIKDYYTINQIIGAEN